MFGTAVATILAARKPVAICNDVSKILV